MKFSKEKNTLPLEYHKYAHIKLAGDWFNCPQMCLNLKDLNFSNNTTTEDHGATLENHSDNIAIMRPIYTYFHYFHFPQKLRKLHEKFMKLKLFIAKFSAKKDLLEIIISFKITTL